MKGIHVSVMTYEVLEVLADIREGWIVDGTVGQAGHAFEILKRTPRSVRLLAFDRDPQAIEASKTRLAGFGERAVLKCRGYEELPEVMKETGVEAVQGILLDLGLSTTQLDSDRGFSFDHDAPLDMRFDPDGPLSAARLIRTTSEKSLARGLRELAQVPAAPRLARVLKERSRAGAMETVADLVDACREVLGPRVRKMDSATLPAMALRIMTNRELERLDTFLDALPGLLAPGGRAVVLSYHSGEDGRVKRAFRSLMVGGGWALPYKKGLKPSADEVAENRRARSARMRVIVRQEAGS